MTGLSRLLALWALCLIASGLPAAGAAPRALGTARALPAELMQQGRWRVEGDGSSVWSLKVESSGATALRVHLSGIQPSTGRLRFLAQEPGQPAVEVDLARRGKESLWSPSVEGSALIIEYTVTGQSSGPPPFRIDALLPFHDEIGKQAPLRFWSQQSPEKEGRGMLTVTAASPVDVQRPPANCQEDPRCSGTTYKAMTDAVAYYRYIDAGGVARACSGTLIRSRIPNAPPVFLTSGDCVKTQAEADTLEAWFQYRSRSCDLAPDNKPSGVKSSGAQLLVSRSGPEGNFAALHLDTVPPGVVPVEYALQAPGILQPVYSVFHPVGSFQRLATGMASQLLESTSYYFDPAAYPDAAYQVIVFTLLGTMETGAEGAAIFDAGSRLVGTMALYPDAPCDLVQTTLMTKFSTIHAAIREYLEESKENGSRGTLTATPNPLLLPENQSTGSVQLKWSAQNATAVQLRLNSPDGAPISGLLPPSGELQTPDWVSDGLEFFLQDASGDDSAGVARTLSSVRVTVRSGDPRVGRILANPNPAEAGTDRIDARVRLIWTAQNVDSVQIRMDGPDGPEVTGPLGLSGSFVVDGVHDGTVFYLQDRSSGDSAGAAKTLARVTVAVNSKVVPKGTLTAEPNPIVAPLSNLTGKVKLAWNATGVRFVEIRMNAPDGPALTGKVSPVGTLEVGFPVGPGTTFFLQDATRADSGSPSRTLARLPILIIAEGPRSGVLSQSPTETQAPPDRIDANVKLTWRATGVAQLAIRSGSSTGPVIADALAPLGEVITAQPLSDGTQLFLQDATGGTSSGDARTLARIFVR
ncbi:MAG: hypothetical protein MUC42_11535, partial [Bryobacter sp.]|nr:hypothetical protein [Bryobacter sp.]